ncbi:MAG: HipA domain-containing protein, partial [Actinomycetota bacterium]|nr:HipA domain-containing protein [Actinomycetota bacterium]
MAVAAPTPQQPSDAFVWVWLPGAAEPVPAGRVVAEGDIITFHYARSYLSRPTAIPLYLPELPLRRGRQRPPAAMRVAGVIRDAGPDAWGQRVILARHLGRLDRSRDTAELSLLTYLLESNSDRIGALDFQSSPEVYVPRETSATLEEVQAAMEKFLAGERFSPDLDEALMRGTSIGGARPKVLLRVSGDGSQLIAKLPAQTDLYPVVRAEAVAMNLAARVGLNVARTTLTEALGRDVLLVERFDRTALPDGREGRRLIVSGLTLLELDEMEGRWATYPELADLVRARFINPDATLRELFSRIVFNICVSNTDDHARNHAAFWDGEQLTLTPAYDLCPQLRSGETASQAMAITRDGRRESRFATCLAAAETYHLT